MYVSLVMRFALAILLLSYNLYGADEAERVFPVEARVAWTDLSQIYQNVNATFSMKSKSKVVRYQVKQARGNFVLIWQDGDIENGRIRLEALNDLYGFALASVDRSKLPKLPLSWSVVSMESLTDSKFADLAGKRKRALSIMTSAQVIESPLRLTGCPSLQELFTNSSCQITNLERKTPNSVVVDFDFVGFEEDYRKLVSPLEKKADKPYTVHGRVVLDPSNYWTIQHYDIMIDCSDCPYPKKVKCAGKIIYGQQAVDGEEYPFPTEHNFVLSNDKEKTKVAVQFIVDSWSFDELPDSDFKLSGYGLPEPLVQRPLFSRRLLFFLAGALLIAVASVFLIRRNG